jgi:probable F420-dependent oxidoreductase
MKVGVVMPIGPDDGQDGTFGWPHVRAMAEASEAAGFDSIWVYDHLLFRLEGKPTLGIHEAWTMLSALAVATERVELGAIVLAMPFRNPALLAKMAVTLDEISAGRLILGVGCGWNEPEFDAFGFPFDHRVGRFEEALKVMVPLLQQGRVTFGGRWHQADDAELIPHYRRPDGRPIPILIAGRRPRMMRLVVEYADAWNAAWLGPVAQLEPRVAPLREALAEAGRDPATLDITVGVSVTLPELSELPLEVSASSLTGSPEELAAELRAYREAGAAHIIVSLEPAVPAAVEHLGRALALLRASG